MGNAAASEAPASLRYGLACGRRCGAAASCPREEEGAQLVGRDQTGRCLVGAEVPVASAAQSAAVAFSTASATKVISGTSCGDRKRARGLASNPLGASTAGVRSGGEGRGCLEHSCSLVPTFTTHPLRRVKALAKAKHFEFA